MTIQPHPLLVFSSVSWPQSQAANTYDTAVPVGLRCWTGKPVLEALKAEYRAVRLASR